MKKLFLVSLIGLMSMTALLAQPSCVKDVWFTVQNGQIGKAKLQIDKCYAQYPEDADVLLMRGNVYLRRHVQETSDLGKDPSYVVKDPNAIFIANESFYQSMQINPDAQPLNGFDAKKGQAECAGELMNAGYQFFNDKKYPEAEKYLNAALRSYKASSATARMADIYYVLALVKRQNGNETEFIENLKLAVAAKTTNSIVYEILYDATLKTGDTVSAFKYVTDGLRNIKADSLKYDLSLKEINHYVLTHDTTHINKSVTGFLEKYGETPQNVANVSQTLTNAGLFNQALDMLLKANEKYDNNKDIVKGLAYSYFFYAIQFQDQMTAALATGSTSKLPTLQAEQKKVQLEAYKWAKKAIELDPADQSSKTMVDQLKAVLGSAVE
ncbi:MAG: hypothetical protein LBV02_08510 [Bacteroidales bacterium]|jgi:tetratricopeptide (TPR) repeat protein|nr:hypothetical protein [Bacteroidales bacterium]